MKSLKLNKDKRWGEEVFGLLSWFDMDKVANAKVMVVGAGALGNEVLKNLALFGVGNIVVVDYDNIEYSNLSRSILFRPDDAANKRSKVEAAAERLRDINPGINIIPIHGNVGPEVGLGLFNKMDLVIGCLDSRLARFFINMHCFRVNKPWVDGGIENLEGYARVFKPGINCYECILTEEELQNIALKTGCPDIAKVNVSHGRIATTPISASIIGAIQVQEALKIIHDLSEKDNRDCRTLTGRLFKYDGLYMNSKVYKMQSHEDDCISHEEWSPILKLKELHADMSVEDSLRLLKEKLNADQVFINLRNNVFIDRIITDKTEQSYEVLLPESKISDFIMNNPYEIDPTERIFQDFTEEIGDEFQHKHLSLRDIGIPYFDIIQVTTSRGVNYVELSGDENKYGI